MIDYASVIWASNATKSALSKLDAIQKIAAQAIIEGFRTVALHTAESVANLQSMQEKFHRHEIRTWIKLYSKPPHNRFWRIKKALNLDNKTWISPLQKVALKFQKLDLSNLEQIYLYTKAPWIPSVKVVILTSRAEAIQAAQGFKGQAGYTDA